MGAHSQASRVKGPRRQARTPRHGWVRARSIIATSLLIVLAAGLVTAAVIVNVQHLRFETVLSGSMRPGIQPGDVVVVRPTPADDITVGEVIAYLPPEQTTPVLHRVIDINSSGLITQGDANNVADPWGRVKPSGDTIDRLVMTIPKIGFIRNAQGPILIGGLALLLAALALAFWPRERRPDSSDDDAADTDTSLTIEAFDDSSEGGTSNSDIAGGSSEAIVSQQQNHSLSDIHVTQQKER